MTAFHKGTVLGFLMALLTTIPSFADHDAPITKNFSFGVELTDDEIRTILQLAKMVGIEQVDEIHTGYVHPSSDRFMSLKEKEIKHDGKVSYRRLFVCKREWTRRPSKQDKTKGPIAISSFWVDRVFREELAIVQIRETEYRIDLRDKIPAHKARDIVAAFLDKKFILSKGMSEKDRENIQ